VAAAVLKAVLALQFALRWLLQPLAWAAAPMEHRVGGLKPPVTFIYGENDWMDAEGGKRVCERLKAEQAHAAPTNGAAAANGSAKEVPHRNSVLFIEKTGHFPFMEKPAVFDELLLDVIGHTLGPHEETGAADRASHDFKGRPVDEDDKGETEDIAAAFTEV
jgi:pimeloyl-ACP methyl ester carboxylesterase